MIHAFLFVALLLLVGVALRQRVGIFRWLFIPASVIAGLIALLLIQLESGSGINLPPTDGIAQTLKSWPGTLIGVVFAGMLLERRTSQPKGALKRVAQQGLMVWIIVLGETAVGLLVTLILVQPLFPGTVPNSFGMLIETGFAGGHGTAAAMGGVFQHPSIAFPAGADLGILMATAGLVYGVMSGILWINIGARFGWVRRDSTQTHSVTTDDAENSPIGFSTISRDAIDPLLFQALILAVAFSLGLAMQTAVLEFAGWLDGPEPAEAVVEGGTPDTKLLPPGAKPLLPDTKDTTAAKTEQANQQLSKRLKFRQLLDFPLFIYTLFGGLITRKGLRLLGCESLIDNLTIGRLTSAAMDILVVAAIATLNLQAVNQLLGPFILLLVAGGLWTAFCLLVISRWVLPQDHWFQLGLINYGMSTGTTATGFVLLRVIDPELESGAAEDYALAAPISAPFIGGGIITVALPLLVLERVHLVIPGLISAAIVVALVLAGRRWNRRP